MMDRKWVALLLAIMFTLSACNSPVYNQTQNNIADVKLKAAAARHASDALAIPPPPLLVNKGLYVDTTPINLARDPEWLQTRIVLRGDQLPFSYYSRTIAAGAPGNILTRYQTGLDPSVLISMNYSGPIKGALDLLATKVGYVYYVYRNSINWQAFVTRTFDVAFMPGSSDYLMGKSSGSSGSPAEGGGGAGSTVQNYVSTDTSNAEYSNLSGKLSLWKDLEATIKQILSPDGKVIVSESTTTVTVRDRPTNVNLVSQYIHNLNNNLSRQVLVKIQVLEVALSNDYNLGINWQLVINAFHNSPFVVNANYGTPISITNNALSPTGSFSFDGTTVAGGPVFGLQSTGGIPSYTILLNALSQQGKTSIVTEPRVLCLNNQVSVVRIVTQEGYVASVQNTSLSGGSGTVSQNTVTSQITPGNLIYGLTLYILPKILKNNIYLQVNADLSTKISLTSFPATLPSTGGSQVQLPTISQKHFNQRSMIRSGDTLILSGFRQVSNTANAMQFLNVQALGGKGSLQDNTETVVLITPIVLHGHGYA